MIDYGLSDEERERLRLERLEILAKEPVKPVPLTEEELKKLKDARKKMTDEEKEAEKRWDSVTSEPLSDYPIPKDLLDKLKREGRL